jgi:hypothetical protein
VSVDDSFIIKKEDLEITLRTQNAHALSEFFDQPAITIAETVTGALAEGKKGVVASAGRLVQGALKCQLLTQFGREIKYFQEKGRIKEDYAKDKYGFQTWVELISAIDSDLPDEERLKAMKALFFAANAINVTDGEKIGRYQLFCLAKKLTSGQLLILKAAHQLSNQGAFHRGSINTDQWMVQISRHLGHGLVALIDSDDQTLVDFRLLNRRSSDGPGSATDGTNARLTDLGLRFCEMIASYEDAVKDMSL